MGIAYEVDSRLVRGLDYYCHTAFEFVCDTLGAQGTLLAGGRYDGLSSALGGPQLPGVGWAGGVERLRDLTVLQPCKPLIFALIPLGDEAMDPAMKLADMLRQQLIPVDMGYTGNMSKRLKRADKINARAALILGGDELANHQILVRDLKDGNQMSVSLDQVTTYLKETFLTKKERT